MDDLGRGMLLVVDLVVVLGIVAAVVPEGRPELVFGGSGVLVMSGSPGVVGALNTRPGRGIRLCPAVPLLVVVLVLVPVPADHLPEYRRLAVGDSSGGG